MSKQSVVSKCIFCGNPIPFNRGNKGKEKPKYCSPKCIKAAYYVRNLKSGQVTRYRPTDKKKWSMTETGKGRKWEIFIANLFNAQLQPFGNHFDLLWKKKKLDVKSANYYFRKRKRGKPVKSKQAGCWRFDRRRGQGDIDYFICIGLHNNTPQKIFVIPNQQFGKRGITISPIKSEYDKFLLHIG